MLRNEKKNEKKDISQEKGAPAAFTSDEAHRGGVRPLVDINDSTDDLLSHLFCWLLHIYSHRKHISDPGSAPWLQQQSSTEGPHDEDGLGSVRLILIDSFMKPKDIRVMDPHPAHLCSSSPVQQLTCDPRVT